MPCSETSELGLSAALLVPFCTGIGIRLVTAESQVRILSRTRCNGKTGPVQPTILKLAVGSGLGRGADNMLQHLSASVSR